MPAKGTKGYLGNRECIINLKFYRQFKKETGIDIDYKTFKDIIVSSNLKIRDIVLENDSTGFKLPETLGYLIINKFRTKNKPVDFKNTKKYNKTIYLPNMHSLQYLYVIKWVKRAQTNTLATNSYKFVAVRDFKRKTAANIKKGYQYHTWTNSDFWSPKKVKSILYRQTK